MDALKELKTIKIHARNIGLDSMTAAAFLTCREEAKQSDSFCAPCYETHNKANLWQRIANLWQKDSWAMADDAEAKDAKKLKKLRSTRSTRS